MHLCTYSLVYVAFRLALCPWVTWMSVRYVCADCESRTGLLSRGGVGEFNLAGSRLCVTRASVRYMCADCESRTRLLSRSGIGASNLRTLALLCVTSASACYRWTYAAIGCIRILLTTSACVFMILVTVLIIFARRSP